MMKLTNTSIKNDGIKKKVKKFLKKVFRKESK